MPRKSPSAKLSFPVLGSNRYVYNPILSQVGCQHEFALRIGRNHVRVRSIVSAHRKTARGRIGGLRFAQVPLSR
jgi:hypothetical protein